MSNNQKIKARKHYVNIPTDYVQDLQQKGNRAKARAFMEYFMDMHNEAINSTRFYAKSWSVSVGTVTTWLKNFKVEIDRYFSFWLIHNESHYTNTTNPTEQNMNTTKNTTEHLKTNQTPSVSALSETQLNTTKNTTEQDMNKDSNKNLNNINVEKQVSTKASSKTIYPKDFTILWELYDMKKSNKKRSLTIYNTRWKDTDIELLKAAIIKAKDDMAIGYVKHFDGFLNGVIDSYLPQRAWLKDAKGNTYQGLYYGTDNLFESDKGTKVSLESVSKLIEQNYFGYLEN